MFSLCDVNTLYVYIYVYIGLPQFQIYTHTLMYDTGWLGRRRLVGIWYHVVGVTCNQVGWAEVSLGSIIRTPF